MSIAPLLGRPGVPAGVTASEDFVFRDGAYSCLPGGVLLDGTKARSPLNADNTLLLEPGRFIGKVTASGKYANTVIGVTAGAYTSGGTSLTVSEASAAELVRRVGASGTFKLVGPATAGGANNVTTVAYSAVNTATGVITVTDIGANRIAGCLVCGTDGSETPVSLVPDGLGVLLDGTNDIPMPQFPTGGLVQTSKLPGWPSDATLKTYLRGIASAAGGKFTFDDQF